MYDSVREINVIDNIELILMFLNYHHLITIVQEIIQRIC